MKPPLIQVSPRPVSLKQSLPAPLQTAFSDGRWNNAANLAKQRHGITKDLYYLAIEVAAKSQGDNVADRSAGKDLVESMIKDNITITDVDTIDMLEFSCSRADVKYSETIGPLRSKFVKSNFKDKASCIRCYDACVYHSDWKHAQLIATLLHNKFADDRNLWYYYILATHLYSLSDDCDKRELYARLAKIQADKAFDFRVMTAGEEYHLDRAVLTESEVLLWIDIRVNHSTIEENVALFRKPEYGALAFLEAGYEQAYSSVQRYLELANAWDDVFQTGKTILEHAIHLSQEEANAIETNKTIKDLRKTLKKQGQTPGEDTKDQAKAIEKVKKDLVQAIEKARPVRSNKDYFFFSTSCEWNLFLSLYTAAMNHSDKKQSLKRVQQLSEKMVKALTRAENMKPIFERTYELATLRILFEMEPRFISDNAYTTTRVLHLVKHVMQHFKDPQAFNDACEFVPVMSQPDVAVFLATLRTNGIQCTDLFQRLTLTSLALRLRYYVSTNSLLFCNCCNAILESPNCASCLKSIAVNALKAYKLGMEDEHLRENVLPHENVDPLSDIAVVGAVCLLKLAGLGRYVAMRDANSPLYWVNMQLFLLAVLWLDSHIIASPKKNDKLRMLLVKLYLLMGCVFRAKVLWEEFNVKNTILASLGLLYMDRLSSIAPGLFMGPSCDNPAKPFMDYYTRAFGSTSPKMIMVALEKGHYGSVLDLIKQKEKQSTSCTLIATALEERRGSRMKAGKIDAPIEDHPLIRNLSIDIELQDITDYGILSGNEDKLHPRLVAVDSQPLYAIVNYGPLPTHTRSHLGVLAERFMDFVCYVQPKEYKPSKPKQVVQMDLDYAVSTCTQITQDMKNLLGVPDEKLSDEEKTELKYQSQRKKALESLTGPEFRYHSIVLQLSDIIKTFLESKVTPTSPNELRDKLRDQVEGLTEALSSQTANFVAVPESIQSKVHGFHGFGAMHAMGMLRESALAVKHTANYLATASEKIKNTDKARSSSEYAYLPAELKKMTAAATEAENTIKTRIKLLKTYLNDVDGWRDRLRDWTFGEYDYAYERDREFKKEVTEILKSIIPTANVEQWADHVGESWRELIKGWAAVKFD